MAKIRLQKILARAGVASRRAAEQLIVQGRVRIDDHVVRELGVRADPRRERVSVDGKRVSPENLVYLLLHKPRGVVSTLHDPEGRPTVRDLVSRVGVRVVPIGRLDYETSGVLLLTNDGDFAMTLAHPKNRVAKTYVAKLNGLASESDLDRFQERMQIDGKWTTPAVVTVLREEAGKTWLQVTLREGRNRQIHRLAEHAGFRVMRLARVAVGELTCEDLRPGQWRHLTVKELTALRRTYGVPKTIHTPPADLPRPARASASPRTRSSAKPRAAPSSRLGAERRAPERDRSPEKRRAPRKKRRASRE